MLAGIPHWPFVFIVIFLNSFFLPLQIFFFFPLLDFSASPSNSSTWSPYLHHPLPINEKVSLFFSEQIKSEFPPYIN